MDTLDAHVFDSAGTTAGEVFRAEDPYTMMFGTDRRPGRPFGSTADKERSLPLPSPTIVKNRQDARRMRDRVERRAFSIIKAIFGPEIKMLYRTEMKLELERYIAAGGEEAAAEEREERGLVATRASQVAAPLIPAEDAKRLPGSGLRPGQSYREYLDDPANWDEDRAANKARAKANLLAVQKGLPGAGAEIDVLEVVEGPDSPTSTFLPYWERLCAAREADGMGQNGGSPALAAPPGPGASPKSRKAGRSDSAAVEVVEDTPKHESKAHTVLKVKHTSKRAKRKLI